MRLPDRICRSSCSTPRRAWSTLFARVSAMVTVRCAETRKAKLMAITIDSTAVVMTTSMAVKPPSGFARPDSAGTGRRLVGGLREQGAEVDVNGQVRERDAVVRDRVGDVTDDGRCRLARRRRARAGSAVPGIGLHGSPGREGRGDLDAERATREPGVVDVHARNRHGDGRPRHGRQGAVTGTVPIGNDRGGRAGYRYRCGRRGAADAALGAHRVREARRPHEVAVPAAGDVRGAKGG